MPPPRRIVHIGLALAFAWMTTEVISLALHRPVLGHPFSPAAFAAQVDRARQAPLRASPFEPRPAPFVVEDVLHPYLGFVGRSTDPGFSNMGFWGSLGWPLPKRDANRLLLGIGGGSFASQLFEHAADRLRRRLAAASQFAGREIVLYDMAYGGWKQPQQFFALGWILSPGGELDVLIDVDGFNEVALDAAENASRAVFPPYPRGWAWRVDDVLDPGDLAQVGLVVSRSEQRAWAAAPFARGPLRFSPTAALVWSLVDRRLARRVEAAQATLAASRAERRDPGRSGPPSRCLQRSVLARS